MMLIDGLTMPGLFPVVHVTLVELAAVAMQGILSSKIV